MDRGNSDSNIQTINPRSGVSVHANRFWSRFKQSHNYSERDHRYKRNGHYKYIPAIIALLFAAPVRAEGVGGVSATASPIANSSGSVTNQAIQVLQGSHTSLILTGEESSVKGQLSTSHPSLQVHFLNNIHMKTSTWILYMICVT